MVWLAALHIFIIALTNVTVQFPFVLWGVHSTFGVFTYPLIFIITDLTVRLLGSGVARRTVLLAMIPGLVLSYLMSNAFGIGHIFVWNETAMRVALASFVAYVLGQLLDIMIFRRFRQAAQSPAQQSWWLAPAVSSFVGNVFDTLCFFFLAFYGSSNPFFAQHWQEIAIIDLLFKLFISLLAFIPLYGVLLQYLKKIQPDQGPIYEVETADA